MSAPPLRPIPGPRSQPGVRDSDFLTEQSWHLPIEHLEGLANGMRSGSLIEPLRIYYHKPNATPTRPPVEPLTVDPANPPDT